MLALRLVRGAAPLALFRRLLLAAAAAGATFLMLGAVGHAADPGPAEGGATRLLWCLVPLTATLQLTVAVARTDTGRRALSGLDAAGMGPTRMPLLAAASATASCLLGSFVALVLFLLLRGHLGGLPFAGAAGDVLGAGPPLPLGAVLLLFLLVPLTAAGTCLVALRPRPLPPGRTEGRPPEPGTLADVPPTPLPPGLAWGTALTATGLALETFAGPGPAEGSTGLLLPMPGSLAGSPPGVLAGWLLTAVGLVLAGPGLTHLCGRLIALGRPGALRLLSGRVLQEDAERVGRPLGVLCAVGSGALAAAALYGPARDTGSGAEAVFGPLTVLGGALVLGCASVSALTAAAESRVHRAPATAALLQLGAPRSLLRNASALRAVTVLAVLGPVAWAVGTLAALPLTG
ncbi:hypothetical protein N566_03555 [Streptomycetaceae bacterium MP113-05]|nr:hypothetical protein N566_03555 [Streptomycetaceae bacterium MP113-05]